MNVVNPMTLQAFEALVYDRHPSRGQHFGGVVALYVLPPEKFKVFL